MQVRRVEVIGIQRGGAPALQLHRKELLAGGGADVVSPLVGLHRGLDADLLEIGSDGLDDRLVLQVASDRHVDDEVVVGRVVGLT